MVLDFGMEGDMDLDMLDLPSKSKVITTGENPLLAALGDMSGSWKDTCDIDGAGLDPLSPRDDMVHVNLSPPAEPTEFSVDVCKDASQSGIEVELVKDMVLVTKLGPMTAWNAAHADDWDLIVRTGDRILRINDCADSCDAIMTELRRERRLQMSLRHPKEFNIVVDGGEDGLGLVVPRGRAKLDMLKVKAVGAGAVSEWNSAHPELEVWAGDRITCVNGICRDPVRMRQELESGTTVKITFLRPV